MHRDGRHSATFPFHHLKKEKAAKCCTPALFIVELRRIITVYGNLLFLAWQLAALLAHYSSKLNQENEKLIWIDWSDHLTAHMPCYIGLTFTEFCNEFTLLRKKMPDIPLLSDN